jgi:hypothetical protein
MDKGHEFRGSGHIQSFSPETNPVADRSARLSKWLTQEGRFLSNNRELLEQFCANVVEAGVLLTDRGCIFARYIQNLRAYPESGDAACKRKSAFSTSGSRSCPLI